MDYIPKTVKEEGMGMEVRMGEGQTHKEEKR